MPTNNSNNLSREGYLKTFGHPRKKELAIMLLDGASVEELNEAGFGRINILEAARDIRLKVEGYADFKLDIPRGTGMDSSSSEDIARTAEADEAEKKGSPSASQEAGNSPEPAQGQPAGDNAPRPGDAGTLEDGRPGHYVANGDGSAPYLVADEEIPADQLARTDANAEGGSVDQVAPSGDVVPGVTANEPTAHPTETIGGNPVGILTGEEDAAALQEKADDQAVLNQGDAA